MTKKTLLIILTIGLIASLSGVAASTIFANDENYSHPLVQRLAEAFNVDEDEVEAVFDAVREEHQQEMKTRRKNKLQQAVEDGIITQEQLKAIEEKHQEIWEEKNQERQQHVEEMVTWFEQEGIDHQALMHYTGGPNKEEFGMRKKHMRSGK